MPTYGTINADTITNSNGLSGNAIGPGFKNRIINGAMLFDQRNNGASVNSDTNVYYLDRWAGYSNPASKFTVQQNAGSVTPPAGFTNYLGVTSSSAYSVPTYEYFTVYQRIEGNSVLDLAWGTANAKTVTLSFKVYSSLTGTFGGSLTNAPDYDRVYPFSYTISSANTWTSISVTIPGDTSGTWNTTASNGVAVELNFGLGAGSGQSGTAGAWTSGWVAQTTGSVSVVSTNGATWYITGVQLEVGPSATSFDYRPYGTELALCQRYYQQSFINLAVGLSASTSLYSWRPVVTMRVTPTPSVVGTGSYSSTTIYYESDPWVTVGTLTSASIESGHLTPIGGDIRVSGTYSGSLTAGKPVLIFIQSQIGSASTSYLQFTSEL